MATKIKLSLKAQERFLNSKVTDYKKRYRSIEVSLKTIGDLMTMEEFRHLCEEGCLVDSDGHAHPIKYGREIVGLFLKPSQVLNDEYDKKCTHIAWYNK